MMVTIGVKRVNRAWAEAHGGVKSKGYQLVSHVCWRATQRGDVDAGDKALIFEGNVIQPFDKTGSDVVLWSGSHIGHDSRIGDHCSLASPVVISGSAEMGPRCLMGVSATLRDGVKVASECAIGRGRVHSEGHHSEERLRGERHGRRQGLERPARGLPQAGFRTSQVDRASET